MTKVQRAFWMMMAVLFLVTSVAFSGLVVWQIHQDNQKKQATENAQKALTAAQDKQKNRPCSTIPTTPPTDYMPPTEKLAGKPLPQYTPLDHICTLSTLDIKKGEGDAAKATDKVTAHYTGAVASTGKVFQSSFDTGQPVPFSLDQVIKGWTEGIPGMQVGGKRRLYIPAEKAYGANPPQGSNIPANADLVFDVELVKIGE